MKLVQIICVNNLQAIEVCRLLVLSQVDFVFKFDTPAKDANIFVLDFLVSAERKEYLIKFDSSDLERAKVALSTLEFEIKYRG